MQWDGGPLLLGECSSHRKGLSTDTLHLSFLQIISITSQTCHEFLQALTPRFSPAAVPIFSFTAEFLKRAVGTHPLHFLSHCLQTQLPRLPRPFRPCCSSKLFLSQPLTCPHLQNPFSGLSPHPAGPISSTEHSLSLPFPGNALFPWLPEHCPQFPPTLLAVPSLSPFWFFFK